MKASIKNTFILVALLSLSISSYPTFSDVKHQHKLRAEAFKLVKRKHLKRPHPSNSTSVKLRDVSISDIEVREIKRSFEKYYSTKVEDDLISIGAVTNNCECEVEQCTNQIFLSYQADFVQFSKIENQWKISTLHKWWQKYNELYDELANPTSNTREIEILESINTLIDSAPDCRKNS